MKMLIAKMLRSIADRLVGHVPTDLAHMGAVERPGAFEGYYDQGGAYVTFPNQMVPMACPRCGVSFFGTHACHTVTEPLDNTVAPWWPGSSFTVTA